MTASGGNRGPCCFAATSCAPVCSCCAAIQRNCHKLLLHHRTAPRRLLWHLPCCKQVTTPLHPPATLLRDTPISPAVTTARTSPILAVLQRQVLAFERRAYLRLRARANQRAATWARSHGREPRPAHLRTGERGEDLAYFHLREQGFTIVARRWVSAREKGDLDLVACDGDTVVIVEVKTRTARDLAPAESAITQEKQQMLRKMAHAYRRRLPEPWRDVVPVRFDVLSVYDLPSGPEFEHIRNAFPLHPARPAN